MTSQAMAEGDTLLLTRAPEPNQRLRVALGALQLQDLHLLERPLFEITGRSLSAEEQGLITHLDQFDDVIFVSQNAVEYGLSMLADYWPQWPVALRWYAVGAITGARLADADIPCTVPDDYSSEGLLALPGLQSMAGRRVLIVRGTGGREVLREELQRRGARVEYLSVYARSWCDYDASNFPGVAPERLFAAVVYSGESLARLAQLLGSPPVGMLLVVVSERLETMAKALGFDKVRVAKPADEDMASEIARNWRRRSA